MLPADTLASTHGDIIIQPINHASLVLGFAGVVLYLDPVGPIERYAGLPRPSLILLTHEHSDHYNADTIAALSEGDTPILGAEAVVNLLEGDLAARAGIIRHGETKEFEGISIRAIPAENTTPERLKNHPPGVGNGYVLSFGDKVIYVSGDTEETPAMTALENIDVAFLPADGFYTMDGKAAAEAARKFRPRALYPFHYGQSGGDTLVAQTLADDPGIEVRLRDWYAE